jgi:hypothetical protein
MTQTSPLAMAVVFTFHGHRDNGNASYAQARSSSSSVRDIDPIPMRGITNHREVDVVLPTSRGGVVDVDVKVTSKPPLRAPQEPDNDSDDDDIEELPSKSGKATSKLPLRVSQELTSRHALDDDIEELPSKSGKATSKVPLHADKELGNDTDDDGCYSLPEYAPGLDLTEYLLHKSGKQKRDKQKREAVSKSSPIKKRIKFTASSAGIGSPTSSEGGALDDAPSSDDAASASHAKTGGRIAFSREENEFLEKYILERPGENIEIRKLRKAMAKYCPTKKNTTDEQLRNKIKRLKRKLGNRLTHGR